MLLIKINVYSIYTLQSRGLKIICNYILQFMFVSNINVYIEEYVENNSMSFDIKSDISNMYNKSHLFITYKCFK